jgi:hypothetical protein
MSVREMCVATCSCGGGREPWGVEVDGVMGREEGSFLNRGMGGAFFRRAARARRVRGEQSAHTLPNYLDDALIRFP